MPLRMPDYAQAELDAQYINTGTPEADVALQALRDRSAANRARLVVEEGHRYGAHPLETFDLFPSGARGPGPALVFVHGGQWRLNTTRETSFWADVAVACGFAFVGLNYPKVPEVRIARQATSVVDAWKTLVGSADGYDIDPRRMVLAGHSSGAHVVALALSTGLDDVAPGPAAVLLYSGVYDMQPVRRSSRNAALDLDPAEAEALSVVRRPPRRPPPVLTLVGAQESAEYRRQARLLHESLPPEAGHRLAVLEESDHFTTPTDLYDPDGLGWNFINTFCI